MSERSRSKSGEDDGKGSSTDADGETLCPICKVKPGPIHIICFDCQICVTGISAYDQHVAGPKHKSQTQSSQTKSGDKASTGGEVTVAQFGKALPLCQDCKKPSPSGSAHVRCEICKICFTSKIAFNEHVAGKAHAAKVKESQPKSLRSTSVAKEVPQQSSDLKSPSALPSQHQHSRNDSSVRNLTSAMRLIQDY